jgi:hypothetical protein
MAKATASDAITDTPGESSVAPAPSVALIIEKYLAKRGDIPDSLKRVFGIIYKGQTHTTDEWDDIINRRISKPAD